MISAPTNLKTTVVNSRAVTLQWDAVASATRYLIWYSLDNIHWRYHTYATTTTTTISGASSTNHFNPLFECLGPDRKVWFRVSACNSTAYDVSEPATLETTIPEFELAPPSNLAVTQIGCAGVKLTWTATTNATKQYILQYRIDDGACSNSGLYWSPSTGATGGTFPDTTSLPSLTPNSRYTFRLKTCITTTGSDLGKSSPWIYSEPVRTPEKCELPAPTNLAKSGTSPSYTWTWDAVPGATSYFASGSAFSSGTSTSPSTTTASCSYSGSFSYTGTWFNVTAFNKTTLERSEASKCFVSDAAPTAPTITVTFKTATTVGLYVNHQTWFYHKQHLLIEYKKATETEWIPVERIGSAASVSPTYIDGLEPDTTYQFRAGFLNFQNNVPAPTVASATTAASEFKRVFFSTGVTAGFVTALALKDSVKFHYSATGTAFTLKSQIPLENPCFYFDEATNLCLAGGKGKLFYSTDFLNWAECKVLGNICDIQYDSVLQKYLLFDEKSRLLTISPDEITNMSILGPFVRTTCEDFSRFVVSDLSEFAFAFGPTTTFTSY